MKFSLLPAMRRRLSVPANSPPIDLRGLESKPKELIRAVDAYLHECGADYETRLATERQLKATDYDWMLPVATSLVNRFRGGATC